MSMGFGDQPLLSGIVVMNKQLWISLSCFIFLMKNAIPLWSEFDYSDDHMA